MFLQDQLNTINQGIRTSYCPHESLEYEFEQEDSFMPYLTSAVCEKCGKEMIDELSSQEREEIAISYLDDLRGIYYNGEARYDS